jgi:tRNA threonylcarbamoyladenosine biosynthesis protein TsaE
MTEDSLVTASQAETESAGERLAASLQTGDVVLLYGDLGVGKTAFVRGLARGLGAPPEEVSSPTFTLVQEYGGGHMTLYHADLYRLEPREVEDLGLDELLLGGIVAVEWAERWADRPREAVEVRLEHAGEDARRISIARRDNAQLPTPNSQLSRDL